jgi:thymidylate synthase
MRQYHKLLREILNRGDVQFEPRTEEHILGISAWQYRFDLRDGFPLSTTKNVPPRLPFEELFWKLRGQRNVKPLIDRNVHIWDANAFDKYLKVNGLREKFPKHTEAWNEEFEKYKKRLVADPSFESAGDLGPVYGYQWRHGFGGDKFAIDRIEQILDSTSNNSDNSFGILDKIRTVLEEKAKGVGEIDQLAKVVKGIKEKPGSRYHVLCAWNPADLEDMALGPCPFWHQFTVYGKHIDLTMEQRSCDVFLGVPFNDAQDALLLRMIANETGKKPRYFNHQFVNVHAYLGVPPRSDFWEDGDRVNEFQSRAQGARKKKDYLEIRDWYLKTAPKESSGNERKDHIPFILEQLSKPFKKLPFVSIRSDIPLQDAIEMKASDYTTTFIYNPHKWDAKATMAT